MTTQTLLTAYLQGAFVMAGLIIALGPQNILALKHSLQRTHARSLITLFIVSDTLLVVLGVLLATSGALLFSSGLPKWITFVAVGYLCWLGLNSLKDAYQGSEEMGTINLESRNSLRETLLLGLTATFLNPGVYIDTVGLIGTLAAKNQPDHWALACGAISTSALWFTGVLFLGRLFHRVFQSKRLWRNFEGFAGVTLIAVAWNIFST